MVGADGEQLGVVATGEAIRLAEQAGYDLVEIAAKVEPPVCKIMDYGKYIFDKNKKEKEARKKQRESIVEVKEMKFRPKIDDHDYEIKVKKIKLFLQEGNKVKLVIMFRGRELKFQDQGLELIERVRLDVEFLGTMEKTPELTGRNQVVIIAPNGQIAGTSAVGSTGTNIAGSVSSGSAGSVSSKPSSDSEPASASSGANDVSKTSDNE